MRQPAAGAQAGRAVAAHVALPRPCRHGGEGRDFFFGRERETVEVIKALAGAPDKLPVLLGNSGVGKSSLAQAGVLAALERQAWPEAAVDTGPWPQVFHEQPPLVLSHVAAGHRADKGLGRGISYGMAVRCHAIQPASGNATNWVELLL